MSSGLSFLPKAGILPLPFVMMVVRSSSEAFCTSSDFKSLAFSALPVGELPLPSAAWQSVQRALKSFSPSLCARTETGSASVASEKKPPAATRYKKLRRIGPLPCINRQSPRMHRIASLAPGGVYAADTAPTDKPATFSVPSKVGGLGARLTLGANHAQPDGFALALRELQPGLLRKTEPRPP